MTLDWHKNIRMKIEPHAYTSAQNGYTLTFEPSNAERTYTTTPPTFEEHSEFIT